MENGRNERNRMKRKGEEMEGEEMRQKEAEPDMERSGVVTRTVAPCSSRLSLLFNYRFIGEGSVTDSDTECARIRSRHTRGEDGGGLARASANLSSSDIKAGRLKYFVHETFIGGESFSSDDPEHRRTPISGSRHKSEPRRSIDSL